MKATTIKKLALVASAGVLFQTAGCSTLIFQLVANEVFTQVLSAIIQGIVGSVDTAVTE